MLSVNGDGTIKSRGKNKTSAMRKMAEALTVEGSMDDLAIEELWIIARKLRISDWHEGSEPNAIQAVPPADVSESQF